LAWSPDGTHLAAGSNDNTIRLWGAATGSELAVLSGHTDAVKSVAWSPDGMRLSSGSWDSTVRLWDTVTGRQLAALTVLWDAEEARQFFEALGRNDVVFSVSWSPDGRYLAAASYLGFWVWDAATFSELAVLAGHPDNVNVVAWSPDGTLLASSSDSEETIRLWDTRTFRQVAVLSGHTSSVDSVAWSPDGTRLVSWDFFFNKDMGRGCELTRSQFRDAPLTPLPQRNRGGQVVAPV
jgi:WD40 repeat protein